ncbi:MAG: MarR family transcriptional regulator [Muribaculaceae bacterium]|nr:MarR family transcriptional regulator [Muribaculaceae bacterium]
MDNKFQPYHLEINTLGFYVDRLLFAMIKRQNQMLKESQLDLQHSEFITLKVLNVLKEASQTEIASVMGKERSGVGRILASLEKKGYIERKPLNGSTNFVTLTEKGKDAIPLITELSNKLTDLTLRGFSAQKRQSILKSLDRLYKNAIDAR